MDALLMTRDYRALLWHDIRRDDFPADRTSQRRRIQRRAGIEEVYCSVNVMNTLHLDSFSGDMPPGWYRINRR